MKIIDSNNQTQNEALLNEYKGNIFEFLTGIYLSRPYNLEILYISNINSEIKDRLTMYEEFIRIKFPQIHTALNTLSLKTADEIKKYLDINQVLLKKIDLIGKSVATNNNQFWGETDLALTDIDNNILKLSLKLSKDHSYTNTKSAGIKSFIEKYFYHFSEARNLQLILNREIDFLFSKMAHELYTLEGLPFKGRFDEAWSSRFSELPGELNSTQKEILFKYYSALNSALFEKINVFFLENKVHFVENILALIGFSKRDIIQVTTFHQNHQFKKIMINTISNLDMNNIQLKRPNDSSHFFEIELSSFVLQIRIKPMNKFTTASYKVNCSIKEKDKK